ncbi:cache domain-containing protein [Cohaesibacter celericrescens]|uniref:cache domain-containing protein n=1 Tax=Cohaesibacter celericrescens TaxID=2067669 RepID=UPI0035634F5E
MSKIRTQKLSNANVKLPFKLKILLIAILPIIAVSALTGWLIHIGANSLIEVETRLIEKRILDFRQQELKNYISLARTAIDQDYVDETVDIRVAQKAVQQILHNLNYGDDGYFFAYDRKGTSLVNAPSPDLIGKNIWYIKDEDGKFLIQDLMRKAVNGGGFTNYIWNKPSTGEKTLKLGYSIYLPKWGWMLGTGLYLDDIKQQINSSRADMRASTRKAETILFLVALLAVVVTAIAVAALHYNEHKLADEKLKALTRRIVDVQEEERKRVSNDLHDGINQLLVSVRHRLELAIDHISKPDKALPLMNKSLSILDTSISDVRRISKALHPSALDNIGLAVAIRELGSDFEESTQIETQIRADTIGNRLSETAKIAIYRVVQEALTNVVRHANASVVQIEMKVDDDNKIVTLKIWDNGEGLKTPDQPSSGNGLGLRNMVERMESQGGNLSIRNGVSGGLELIGLMPQV